MPFRVAISTAPDPQEAGRVDILTHPYTTVACAAGVATGTADRDSSRYRYGGNRRTRQLALDCEGIRVKSTHDVYKSMWKYGELTLIFFSIRRRIKIRKKWISNLGFLFFT